jgi:C1A family cysteine protease
MNKDQHICNTKKSKKDNRDWLKSVMPPELPKYIIEHNIPIRNQGIIGSCLSHAVVRSVEIQLLKKRKWFIEGSELYHYYMVRKEINKEYPNDSGMTVRDGCKGIQKYGSSLELVWPYNVKKFNDAPSLVSHWLSGLTKAASYFRLNDIETIKHSISCDIPVVCGVFVDDNYYKLYNNNAEVWTPGGKKRGGHAQICIGYDDNKKILIIENSWGESFGKKGTFSISYDDFKKVSFDWFQIII